MNTRNTDVNHKKDILFPLDETASLASNFIKDEIHTVSSTRVGDYHLIVPEYPPFYVKDLKVRYKKNANSAIVTLEENIDYSLGLYYKGATERIGLPVYGAIILNPLDLDGVIFLDYRIVGGDQVANRKHVLETLVENVWNPREKDWIYVTDKPNLYPPLIHEVDWNNITTVDDLLEAFAKLTDTISEGNLKLYDKVEEYLRAMDVEEFKRYMDALKNHSYTSLLNENLRLQAKVDEFASRYNDIESRLTTVENKLK